MKANHARLSVAAICVLGMLAALASPVSLRAASGFFSGLPDLPLMSGLSEDRAATVVFDKPEGRIVRMTATGGVSRAAVRTYYGRVLPPLGWKMVGPDRFRRDGEILLLRISGTGRALTLRISLGPE